MNYRTVKTSELKQGDVVNCHGLRCLIDGDIIVSRSHPNGRDGSQCRYTVALVLNRNQVPGDVVPRSWTADWKRDASKDEPKPHVGQHRWAIQGNDLALWSVEDGLAEGFNRLHQEYLAKEAGNSFEEA